MRRMAVVCLGMMLFGLPVSAGQHPKLSDSDLKELAGRWIGTVTADIGEMPIALDLKAGEGTLTGDLETAHGNWRIKDVRKQGDTWTLSVTAPDGLEGTLAGRVRNGRLTGDWNFKPRAVGTFDLARPAPKR